MRSRTQSRWRSPTRERPACPPARDDRREHAPTLRSWVPCVPLPTSPIVVAAFKGVYTSISQFVKYKLDLIDKHVFLAILGARMKGANLRLSGARSSSTGSP